MNGADRAIVPIGVYEDVLFSILWQLNYSKVLFLGIQRRRKLGILELDEEDLSLATYVSWQI